MHGVLEFREAMGSAWTYYQESADLMYGISSWNMNENYVSDGSMIHTNQGFRFGLAFDVRNDCQGESPEPNIPPIANQTIWGTFWARSASGVNDWSSRMTIVMQKLMASVGVGTSDWGSFAISHSIYLIDNPPPALTARTISSFADNGGGSYTIQWVATSGTSSYRVKWGEKQIVDWIGFDIMTNTFTGNPATTMNWFAANNATSIPAPGVPGTTESITVATGVTGLTAANFKIHSLGGTDGGGGGGSSGVPNSRSGAGVWSK
jgi:hypothetical protein